MGLYNYDYKDPFPQCLLSTRELFWRYPKLGPHRHQTLQHHDRNALIETHCRSPHRKRKKPETPKPKTPNPKTLNPKTKTLTKP